MAIDDELTQRMRTALADLSNVREQKMMGGVCFLLSGNMLCGANREKTGLRRFMFRVGRNRDADFMDRDGAMPMVMGARRMQGYFFLDADQTNTQKLDKWIGYAVEFVETLPAK